MYWLNVNVLNVEKFGTLQTVQVFGFVLNVVQKYRLMDKSQHSKGGMSLKIIEIDAETICYAILFLGIFYIVWHLGRATAVLLS